MSSSCQTSDFFFNDRNHTRTIFQALTDGVMIFDKHGKVLSVNPAAETVIGHLERDVRQQVSFGIPEIEAILAQPDLVSDTDKVKCWEKKNCTHPECPSYDSTDLRCWLQCGTHCHNEIQGTFQQKRDACERCDVYLNNGVKVIELSRDSSFYTAQISPILNESGQEEGKLVIFHNITDLRTTQNRLIHRNRDLTLLNEVSSKMTHSILDVDFVLSSIFDIMLKSLTVDMAALVIRDEQTDKLEIRCSRGFPDAAMADVNSILAYLNAGQQATRHNFSRIKRSFLDSFRPFEPKTPSAMNPLLLPLQIRNTCFGFIMVADRQRQGFEENELFLFSNIASQISMYMQNVYLINGIMESQKEWETTFDAMTDAVSIHDTNFNIMRANRSMRERFQGSGDIVGKKCFEVIHRTAAMPATCPCQKIFTDRRGLSLELEDELMGDVILSIDPIFGKDGAIIGFVHVIKDVAEQKQLRSQLLQSEKMAAVGQLVSGVAHELNNPLASIMGYAQFLMMQQGHDPDSAQANDLKIIFDESQRASRIVGSLLSFARKHESKKKYVDLNDVIMKMIELKRYECRVSDITIAEELEPVIPRTMADQHQIEQVLLNLMNNAQQAIIESGNKRGVIGISTRVVAGALEVSVSDNGTGMEPDVQGRVFDPFFTTKPVGKGTGLGLSICYGIVSEHDGEIRILSEPGKGSTFTVSLPVNGASVGSAEAQLEEPLKLNNEHHRVLVVEDEPSFCRLLQQVLMDDGHNVDVATNGLEALSKLRERNYDNVITDIKMPEMNGPELFEHIAQIDPSLSENIIFITGDSLSPDTHEFLRNKNNLCLKKPFDLKQITRAIRMMEQDEKRNAS